MVSQHNTKMPRCQSIVASYTKNQNDLKLKEKKESIDTETQMTELLELSDKDFKAALKRMLQQQLWTQ